jgi:diguanylate cyclase (GGDEF)-like protein
MIDAILLLQDVQLLCFTVIFFFVARQHPNDRARRWLWYSFLANAVGAVMDFTQAHLPAWVGRGINLEMIPLSYALLTVAFAYFLRRYKPAIWASFAIMLAALPTFLLWSGRTNHVPGDTLVDLVIGLQVLLLGYFLPRSPEAATRSPRILMAAFFYAFAAVELTRAFVAFVLVRDPDSKTWLGLTSSVAYIVSTSVLPLGFIWMMNSRLEYDLIQQNMLDPLTHVLNRRGLRRAMQREMARLDEDGSALTVAILDLDHFKRLNDTFGHVSGDAMLIGLAGLLGEFLRENDTIARIGGEEFVLLLPGADTPQAEVLLERLRTEVEKFALRSDTGEMRLTASFGATVVHTGSSLQANELLREADVALYRAKQEGRNCVRFFAEEEDGGAPVQSGRSLGLMEEAGVS